MNSIFITDQYHSNCFIEAIKAKCRNRNVKIYFCKPRFLEDGSFQMAHFMWSDGTADYDFSDNEPDNLPWYRCFWFKGAIRQFKQGFAQKYADYRNQKGGNTDMKRILVLLLIAALFLSLAGCGTKTQYADVEINANSRFELIAKYGTAAGQDDQYVYVDKQTGVQYVVFRPYNQLYGSWGSILFGADGLPLLYEGKQSCFGS